MKFYNPLGDHDSEDEVESVDNDMALERVGFATKSFLEQWRDSYDNGEYDENPYDDDMYEGKSGWFAYLQDEKEIGEGEFGRVYVGRRVTGVSGRMTLREGRLKLTFFVFIMIMLLGFLKPVVDQNLFFTVLKYITATFAVAMGNIIPAMTFLIIWVCRLEKVNIKKIHSIRKIFKTLVTVGGAMIMTYHIFHPLHWRSDNGLGSGQNGLLFG
nr:WAT1-related protein At2g39510-like [Tanacetum cinerariifolium]